MPKEFSVHKVSSVETNLHLACSACIRSSALHRYMKPRDHFSPNVDQLFHCLKRCALFKQNTNSLSLHLCPDQVFIWLKLKAHHNNLQTGDFPVSTFHGQPLPAAAILNRELTGIRQYQIKWVICRCQPQIKKISGSQ